MSVHSRIKLEFENVGFWGEGIRIHHPVIFILSDFHFTTLYNISPFSRVILEDVGGKLKFTIEIKRRAQLFFFASDVLNSSCELRNEAFFSLEENEYRAD